VSKGLIVAVNGAAALLLLGMTDLDSSRRLLVAAARAVNVLLLIGKGGAAEAASLAGAPPIAGRLRGNRCLVAGDRCRMRHRILQRTLRCRGDPTHRDLRDRELSEPACRPCLWRLREE
jgi:hypothetical protein